MKWCEVRWNQVWYESSVRTGLFQPLHGFHRVQLHGLLAGSMGRTARRSRNVIDCRAQFLSRHDENVQRSNEFFCSRFPISHFSLLKVLVSIAFLPFPCHSFSTILGNITFVKLVATWSTCELLVSVKEAQMSFIWGLQRVWLVACGVRCSGGIQILRDGSWTVSRRTRTSTLVDTSCQHWSTFQNHLHIGNT